MPKPLSEADKLKNEKSLILFVYTIDSQGRPSQHVTKIHQNPVSEVTFFETKKRPGNSQVLASKMISKTRSKNRIKTIRNPPGDPLGTPWEPPRDPGPKINDSEVDFEVYFESQSMKSETKVSQNQRSGRPRRAYQRYIGQFDKLNRSQWVSDSQNSHKFSKSPPFQNINVKKSNLQTRKLKLNSSISKPEHSTLKQD